MHPLQTAAKTTKKGGERNKRRLRTCVQALVDGVWVMEERRTEGAGEKRDQIPAIEGNLEKGGNGNTQETDQRECLGQKEAAYIQHTWLSTSISG